MGFYETPKDKTWIVPENQVQGNFERKFAIMPCEYSENSIEEIRTAQAFATPLLSYADSSSAEKFAGGRPCVQDSDVSEIFKLPDPYQGMILPNEMSFIDSTNNNLLFSTVKMTEVGDDFILRMWNPINKAGSEKITFGKNIKKLSKANFMEESIAAQTCDNDSTVLDLKPCEIVTLKFKI